MSDFMQSQLAFIDLDNTLISNWQRAIAPLIPASLELSAQLTASVSAIAEQYLNTFAPIFTDFAESYSQNIQSGINQIAKLNLPVSISLDKMYKTISATEKERPISESEQNILKYTSQNLSLAVSLPSDKVTDKTLNEFYDVIVKLERQSNSKTDGHHNNDCHEIHPHTRTSFLKMNAESIASGVITAIIVEIIKAIFLLVAVHGDKVYPFVMEVLDFITKHFS